MLRIALFILLLFGCATLAAAQSNDVAVTGGGMFAFTNPLDLGAAWALEGTFAHRIAAPPVVSLYLEVPVAGSFSSSIPTLSGISVARSYTSLFVTPGLRVKLAPAFPLSPYFPLVLAMHISIINCSMEQAAQMTPWLLISAGDLI